MSLAAWRWFYGSEGYVEYPQNLLKVFQDGARCIADDPWKTSLLRVHLLGEVTIISGFLVATCPTLEPDMPPITTQFPLGRFPVLISEQHRRLRSSLWSSEVNPETIAYSPYQSLAAMVCFSDEIPAQWHLSALPTWSAAKVGALDLERDFYGGFLNETGSVYCVMDAVAGQLIAERMAQDDNYGMELYDQLDLIEEEETTAVELDAVTGLNLVAFGAGVQGVSPAFVGCAADGTIARLVVDLGFQGRTLLAETTWQPPEP
jgi:hypothetical protein